MTVTIFALKELMLATGLDAELVSRIDPARPLIQQGVDSVDYPGFILAFEEACGVKVSDADSLRLKTLDDFLNFAAART
ncbi:MAG: phosphopantetheine-binding protein [Proteobacteria bacterium]|nr:phosphopantetheine-binding protein [Pseudomonadota bacterium]